MYMKKKRFLYYRAKKVYSDQRNRRTLMNAQTQLETQTPLKILPPTYEAGRSLLAAIDTIQTAGTRKHVPHALLMERIVHYN